MSFFYGNLFSEEESKALAYEVLTLYKNGGLVEDVTPYTNGSLGAYNLPSTLEYVARFEELIKKDYGDNVKFENTFIRMYRNGNDLKIHTDRPGLDITLSACVYTNLTAEWPMYVSNILIEGPWESVADPEALKEDFDTAHTAVGTGVACLGTQAAHWRDPLVCGADQYVIQVFYHWSFI